MGGVRKEEGEERRGGGGAAAGAGTGMGPSVLPPFGSPGRSSRPSALAL